jgi:hypothetical protein
MNRCLICAFLLTKPTEFNYILIQGIGKRIFFTFFVIFQWKNALAVTRNEHCHLAVCLRTSLFHWFWLFDISLIFDWEFESFSFVCLFGVFPELFTIFFLSLAQPICSSWGWICESQCKFTFYLNLSLNSSWSWSWSWSTSSSSNSNLFEVKDLRAAFMLWVIQ